MELVPPEALPPVSLTPPEPPVTVPPPQPHIAMLRIPAIDRLVDVRLVFIDGLLRMSGYQYAVPDRGHFWFTNLALKRDF
jgi:hypothetical protein